MSESAVTGSGVTTKEVDSNGNATVVTVSKGDSLSVPEPEKITITIPANETKKDLGIVLSNLCIKKVTPNTFAKKNGSFPIGHQVYSVNGVNIKSDKEFRDTLGDLKKKGKSYKVVIGLSEKEVKRLAAEEAERREKEEKEAAERAKQEEEERKKAEEEAVLKAKEEEEAKRRQEEEEEEAKRKQAEEEEKKRLEVELKAKSNGNVRLIYEMYDQEFPIKDGSLTAAQIDEEYAMTFVMPGCHIHLSVKKCGGK